MVALHATLDVMISKDSDGESCNNNSTVRPISAVHPGESKNRYMVPNTPPTLFFLLRIIFTEETLIGDPDLSTTAEALKVFDSCGSDIIELGVPYSDPLADGPGDSGGSYAITGKRNFNVILSMLKEVVPQLSCPIALFTYYNPILKCGVEQFMHCKGSELNRSYWCPCICNNQACCSRLWDIETVTCETVCRDHQVAEWGANGVIVGSAMVNVLGEAKSPEEGLKELGTSTRSLKSALEHLNGTESSY
ncbi:Tryptophan synthase alpha chain [Hibiscus syriacus]|uniref:tryptophan synthase n=1 Tax=Hibiscus syriacus TaxID=106335 RepID=A0A6A2YYB4_HIBSY|nr:Tryptophan synthase alpha chain [Hibiscus syriacus]